MKTVIYSPDAQKALRKHRQMAGRIRRALTDYAQDGSAHANNVRLLVGSNAKRMRIASFRVIFEESETTLVVTVIGPRGSIYGG